MALSKDVNIPEGTAKDGNLMLDVNQSDFTRTLQFLTKQAVRVSGLGAAVYVRASVEMDPTPVVFPDSFSTRESSDSKRDKPVQIHKGGIALKAVGTLVVEVVDSGMGLSEVSRRIDRASPEELGGELQKLEIASYSQFH